MRSRGLGVVRLEIDRLNWFDADSPQHLLEYLQKLVRGDETAYQDTKELKDGWVQALIDHLQQINTQRSRSRY